MNINLILQENVKLSDLCTFGIGGPARYFLEVHSIEQMQEALLLCKSRQLPYFILGKGSNCLFDDLGFNGLVILNKIDFLSQPKAGVFHVGAGYSFSLLGVQTARKGFSGLEFASGIPGSVGGAVYMNAGANGAETCQCLLSVDFLNENGILCTFNRDELHFSYRKSPFQQMQGAIVSATFALVPNNEARKKQIALVNYRTATQPYGEMSAGCVFKNPSCHHAGALIEQNHLKGFSVGGAKVSEKHANFIVNTGNASSQDVLNLIHLIKTQIKEKKAIDLDTEIRFVSYQPKDLIS